MKFDKNTIMKATGIKEEELENLKKICEEIFGESNFVANIVWKHTQQSKNHRGSLSAYLTPL